MLQLIIAIYLGLAFPSTTNTTATTDRHVHPVITNFITECPYGVPNCACQQDNYTGGDTGHIPTKPPGL